MRQAYHMWVVSICHRKIALHVYGCGRHRDMARPGTDGDDAPWSADDERLAALVDRERVDHPACGARKIARAPREPGKPRATRWRVTRLMGLMGMRT
ncbi:hypothetical protein I3I95_03800 [bacterium]|nr:hypothetical protein [bacterium]